ncbi:MAG: inorganic diphosphatase [Ignavibacteriales bacterium]
MNAIVEVIVEIPAGSRNKYEYDPERRILRLDRVLHSSVHYPGDYGYIVETLAEDGDAADALVMVTSPTVPGCLVEARVVGVLSMTDHKGRDDKLLGVPVGDPRFNHVHDLADVPDHVLREIEHFFQTYKALEEKTVLTTGWKGADEAAGVVKSARANYARSRRR